MAACYTRFQWHQNNNLLFATKYNTAGLLTGTMKAASSSHANIQRQFVSEKYVVNTAENETRRDCKAAPLDI